MRPVQKALGSVVVLVCRRVLAVWVVMDCGCGVLPDPVSPRRHHLSALRARLL